MMRNLITIISVILVIMAAAVMWAVNADGIINPFSFGDSYDLKFTQNLPDGGKTEIEMLKNRPETRIKKWDGEVNMGIAYKKVEAEAEKSFLSNKVEWKNSTEEVHAYPIQTKSEQKDGKFEIEVILNEKSDTNKFEFAVNGAENLDFFYQPPLNEELLNHNVSPKAVRCTETECFDGEGKRVTYRPENVVGSYAVYHKTLRDHIEGQTNYGTGKVFHIYRPKAIDANGVEQWAILNYENGILSVTVPQEFLDKAAYPVIVDPTFGYTGNGGTTTGFEGVVMMGRYSIPTNGTGSKISVLIDNTYETLNVKCNVYQDETGEADVNVALFTNGATEEKSVAVGNDQWIDFNFSSAPSFVSGTYYRLATWSASGGGTNSAHYDSGISGENGYYVILAYGAWPDPSGALTRVSEARFSIYATYTTPETSTIATSSVKVRGGTATSPVKIRGGSGGGVKFR